MRILIILLLVLHVFAGPVWAAIVCGNETSSGNFTTNDPATLVYTPDMGTHRILIVGVSILDLDADNITCVSVVSDTSGALTSFGIAREETDGTEDTVACLYYTTSITDGAQTITVEFPNAPISGNIVAYTCTGVNTASPWRDVAVTATGDDTTMTMNVPSAVGDLVVDHGTWTSLAPSETPAMGAGQTSMYTIPIATDNMDVVGSTEPGAASVTMSWTATTSDPWAQVGGSLVPATAIRRGVLPLLMD